MSRRFTRSLLLGAILAGLAILAHPSIARQDPADDDDAAFERLRIERVFAENCQMCHTPEMVSGQRLTPPQWAAEVDKMIGWGSPLPPEEKEPLIAYLAAEYPADKAPATLTTLAPADKLAIERLEPPTDLKADATLGASLYATHCASCHAENARGGDLGTNRVNRPVLVDVEEYGEVTHNGRLRMPGFSEVLTAEQSLAILAWLRDRPYPEMKAASE